MRITSQLLRSRTERPLNSTEYIDLSNLSIVFIEKLQLCPKLNTIILRGNSIEIVNNLESCHQLWRLDLGNNKISNLEGLSKFVALGELNLSNNDLIWPELMKIRHMHILHLSLHGNKKMEKDPYYRIHVIDSLPNIWMLDGRIVTSAERIQVQQFFQDSALADRPVRHKLTREQFVPTSMKKIQVQGIYGERTTHFMVRFPTCGAVNVDTDRRRLKYLAGNMQRELQLEAQHRKSDPRLRYSEGLLEGILEARPEDRDRCNVLLILLVASLEFALPSFLLQETLGSATINVIGNCDMIELFVMPHDHRCQVASLLLSAIKVERDSKEDGGLYDKLYLCLYYTVAELVKKWHLVNPGPNTPRSNKVNPLYSEYKSLLAAEAVQLFCIVPSFFDYITKDAATMHLVSVATADNKMPNKVSALIERIRIEGGTTHKTIEEVAGLLINTIHRNTKHILKRRISITGSSTYVLSTSRALPRRPMSSPVHASCFLTTGKHSPERAASARPPTARSPRRHVVAVEIKTPALGDKVLLGPQNVAFIIALPDPDVGLLQMESIPDLSKFWKVPNGSVVSCTRNTEQHFAYVDLTLVVWDRQQRYWKPKGSTGDRITIQNIEDHTPANPPTSPTVGNSPNNSPRTSHRTVKACAENPNRKSKDTTVEEIHHSVSTLLRERLKINPSLNDRVATPSAKTSPRASTIPDCSIDICNKPEPEQDTSIIAERGLYDCVKCAVERVQKSAANSPRRDAENEASETEQCEEENIESVEVHIPDVWNAASQKTFTSRPVSSMTERAADELLVDEFADVNLVTDSIKQYGNGSDRPSSSVRRRNRPGTARTSASSRINSAKSTSSWRSLPVTRSQAFEAHPGNVTNFQIERAEVWKDHVGQLWARQGKTYSRPSTPSRSSTPTRSRHPEPPGQPLLMQYGNSWLAGGQDIHYQTQMSNKKKAQYSPGWRNGMLQRPKSSGVFRTKKKQIERRAVKSAGTSRDKVAFDIARPVCQPPPSPASSDHAFHPNIPDYLQQARQQNFAIQRPATAL